MTDMKELIERDARSLGKNTLNLISRILEKHDKAVLEVCFEMQKKIDSLSDERDALKIELARLLDRMEG